MDVYSLINVYSLIKLRVSNFILIRARCSHVRPLFQKKKNPFFEVTSKIPFSKISPNTENFDDVYFSFFVIKRLIYYRNVNAIALITPLQLPAPEGPLRPRKFDE